MKAKDVWTPKAGEPQVYNFSGGPAMLPGAVMVRAQEEFRNYAGTGLSMVETSHRSRAFAAVVERTETDLRALLGLPEEYAVLFLQGGASLQFLMVALNLARPGARTAYIHTGHWSAAAIAAAREVRAVDILASAEPGYTAVPVQEQWRKIGNAAYLHYTANETVDGLEFNFHPETDVPLVADMSSTILSRPLPAWRFGLIYAGAQKNLGPAGITLVILRRELAEKAAENVPSMLAYRKHIAAGSLLNTPPTFAWYLVGLTLKWVRQEGGLEEMGRRSTERSRLVYEAIDRSGGFYVNDVEPPSRSRTNIPFRIADARLESRFLLQADEAGLKELAGYRTRGGVRASLYNAMPVAGAQALVNFMNDFVRRYG